MGIKFRCPICDKKIHVKSYLAGKRGLCPACGAKVTIPAESGDNDDEGALDEHASRVDLMAENIDPLAKTTISQGPSPVPQLLAAHQAQQQADAAGLPPAALPQAGLPQPAYPPAGIPQAAIPEQPYQVVPQAGVPLAGIPQPAAMAAIPQAAIPQAAIPQAAAPIMAAIPQAAIPQAAIPQAPIPQAAIPQAAIPPVVVAPPGPPPAAKTKTRDILAEDPNAHWYVRLSSGDQFGPAKGPDMTEWLAEGRIQPDALVWREGWGDWKRAEFAFPQLRDEEGGVAVVAPPKPIVAKAVAATPVGVLVKRESESKPEKPPEEDTAELLKSVGDTVEPASTSRSSGSTYTPPPKSNAGTVAAVVGGLAVVVIAPLLVYVLMSQPGGSGGGGILGSVTGPSWETHSGPGFTVRFPMDPRESPQSEMTPAGAFKGTRYLADYRNHSGYAFSVTSGEVVDPAAATARLDDFCQESAANAAKSIPGGVVSKGEPIPGFTGREYRVTSEVVGDHVLIRVILAGKRRFTVAVQAQGSKSFEAPIVEQFLSSFKLTEAGEPEKKRKG